MWERFLYLFHFEAYGLQAVGEPFLQDVELGFSEVQRGSASPIQGVDSGPCRSKERKRGLS